MIAGLFVSLPALWSGLAIIAALLLLKLLTKITGVWPLARLHYMGKREAAFTTLLMATGLMFGTISALFGLQNKIIDQRQYTILVTVVQPECLRPHSHRPEVLSTHTKNDAGPRAALSAQRDFPVSA